MIDGLKVTMDGSELRALLQERMEDYEHEQEYWKKEASDDTEQAEDVVAMPRHICENEARRCGWRAEVLGFIHDHLDPREVYLLGQADLKFGEFLPAKPELLGPWDLEDENPDVKVTRVDTQGGPEVISIERVPRE